MNDHLVCRCVSGRIEVIVGPMCAEKTQELIRRLTRAEIAGIPTIVFKPARGRQIGDSEIVSRQGCTMEAKTLETNSAIEAVTIVDALGKRCAVGFDEAHWISDLKDVCGELADHGHMVFVAGLDMDYRGIPYTEMCLTMGIAEAVDKMTAVSIECGCPATHTTRLGDGEDAGGTWEPMCRNRWQKHRSKL